jgi:hypothetical protein
MADWCTVLGVDYQQFARLRLVAPTWAKNRQEIYRHPLLCFCAYPDESPGWWKRQISIVTGHPDIRVIGWPEFEGVSQRHRMLSAFTWGVAAYCETPWHFKLDLDCCVMPNEAKWPPEEWFSDEHNYQFIAPKWGYTKPAQMYLDLCKWGKTVPAFIDTAEAPGKWADPLGKCKHGRIISYAMYGRTEFAKELARLADPPGPVPSHDTFWWYVAERLGRPYLRVRNVGEYGFSHKSRGLGKRCKVAVEEVANANPA